MSDTIWRAAALSFVFSMYPRKEGSAMAVDGEKEQREHQLDESKAVPAGDYAQAVSHVPSSASGARTARELERPKTGRAGERASLSGTGP